MQATVFLIFVTRELALTPAAIGLVLGIGGAGSLAGAALAGRTARLIGLRGVHDLSEAPELR